MSIRDDAQKPRVRRTQENAREHILAAAEALLVDHGPQTLKLADVAAAAGVANATVLHHFSSIDGVQTALMERMIEQLVAKVMAASDQALASGDADAVLQALFDVFEARGAARLAAWLELRGEATRLATVRQAVQTVVQKRLAKGDINAEAAQDMILISVVLAMGSGLFGQTLAELVGKPPEHTRALAVNLLRALLKGNALT